jgi:hypothetical protein
VTLTFTELHVQAVPVNGNCQGVRWEDVDSESTARMIAIVAMGLSEAASNVIKALAPEYAPPSHAARIATAVAKLTVKSAAHPEGVPLYHRDGLIFEVISWLVATQQATPNTFIRPPHVNATTQGMDGLAIELSASRTSLEKVTIFEDKCSKSPTRVFNREVIPSFLQHHSDGRIPELVSTATALIRQATLSPVDAVRIAEEVLNHNIRQYQAALAVGPAHDSEARRNKIFNQYSKIKGITSSQRVAATFVVNADVRVWFEQMATKAVTYLKGLEEPNV